MHAYILTFLSIREIFSVWLQCKPRYSLPVVLFDLIVFLSMSSSLSFSVFLPPRPLSSQYCGIHKETRQAGTQPCLLSRELPLPLEE